MAAATVAPMAVRSADNSAGSTAVLMVVMWVALWAAQLVVAMAETRGAKWAERRAALSAATKVLQKESVWADC